MTRIAGCPFSRVVRGWAVAGAVCLLAPLCPRPAHAVGHSIGHEQRRATASSPPVVGPLRTVRVGQNPALVAIDARDQRVLVANEGPLTFDYALPTRPGSVSVIDERTGAVLRTVRVGQGPVSLAFDAPTGRVFVLCAGRVDFADGYARGGGSVSVLDAATGALLRTLPVGPTPLTIAGPGTSPGGRQALAVDSTNGRVYVAVPAAVLVLDGATGVVRRTITVRGGVTPNVTAPSIIALGRQTRRLYVADSGDTMMPFVPLSGVSGLFGVLDAATGKGIANVAVTDSGISVIAVDEQAGRVLVFELHGNREYSTVVNVLDARSGKLLHTTDLGVPSDGGVAVGVEIATGRIFVLYTPSDYEFQNGAVDRQIDILDARSGKLLRTVHLPTTTNQGFFISRVVTVDERDNRVLVAVTQGQFTEEKGQTVIASDVYVLDARSGVIMRSLQVGPGPQDVAVDEVVRRVFVTNERSDTLSVFDAAQL